MRYYVPESGGAPLLGTAALQAIDRVRVALDQANGLLDALGQPTTKTMYLVSGPCTVDRDVDGHVTRVHGNVLATHERAGSVTSASDVIVADDGSAALALADDMDEISEHLGTTVRGQALPQRRDLVAESALPTRVKAAIDKTRAVAELERAIGIAVRKAERG
jgi:hypothetical protein